MNGPSREEWLALIQTIVGENGRAISILTRLVQTPYLSWLYGGPVTPALLRLDPIWTFCAPIPLSKNSARKSSRQQFPMDEGDADTNSRGLITNRLINSKGLTE